jgi:hypothetical protein
LRRRSRGALVDFADLKIQRFTLAEMAKEPQLIERIVREHLRGIACCDLATQDPDVIRAHVSNGLVIGGRYNTRFSSAFMVTAPVPVAKIVSVERVDCRGYALPDVDVSLDRTLGR